MKVLYVAAECKPFSKMGGVADVAGELPVALKKEGVDITVITPLYKCVDRSKIEGLHKKGERSIDFEGEKRKVTLWQGNMKNVPVLFVENPDFLTAGPHEHSYIPFTDDAKRFSFFAKAIMPYVSNFGIVHGNDWLTGYLFGEMIIERKTQKRVLTVHNIGYQGNIWIPNISGWDMMQLVGHPKTHEMFMDPHKDWHSVNAMRLALELSHITNAVSPTYALEMQQPEDQSRYFEGGKGLDEICRRLSEEGRLIGILNGYEYKFDPTDQKLRETIVQKAEAKKGLKGYFNKPNDMLLGFVGRAVEQKFKLLAEEVDGRTVAEHLLEIPGINLAMLGTGLPQYESFMGTIGIPRFAGSIDYDTLMNLARRKNYFSVTAFDSSVAARLNAACDALLNPSLFEPCGITQLDAMASATPPIVRWTGGLKDTVIHYNEKNGTGFGFDGASRREVLQNLIGVVLETKALYENPEAFAAVQKNAFFTRFTWDVAAKQYIEKIYEPLMRLS